MRLHRLRLAHFRGVRTADVEFPETGITVLHGPNEVGKSSLVEALDLLLDEKDTSTKAAVRAVKPVDADEGSEVEAEISTGGYRFGYRKRFNKGGGTWLSVTAPNRLQLTGSAAHDWVRRVLAETMDDRLYRAVRILQGATLEQARFAASVTLLDALDRAAGAAAEPTAGESLLEAVEAEYRRHFTATGRPTGGYRDARREQEQAHSAVEAARIGLAEVGRLAAAVAELTADQQQLRSGVVDAERECARCRSAADRVEQIRSRVARSAAVADGVSAEAEQMATVRRQRLELVRQVHDRHATADRLAPQADAAAAAVAAARAGLAAAVQAVGDARAVALRARLVSEHQRAHLEHLRDAADADALRARIGVVRECRAALAASKATAGQAAVIDDSVLARLEQADRERAVAVARRDVGAGQVMLHAETPMRLVADGVPVQLGAGPEWARPVTADLELAEPGRWRLTLRPAAATRALAEEADSAEQRLADLLSGCGVADLTQARTVAAKRRAELAERAAVQRRLAETLAGADPDSLSARLAELEAAASTELLLAHDLADTATDPSDSAATSDSGASSGTVTSSDAVDRSDPVDPPDTADPVPLPTDLAGARVAARTAAEVADQAERAVRRADSTHDEARRRERAAAIEAARLAAELAAHRAEIAAVTASLDADRQRVTDDALAARAALTAGTADRARAALEGEQTELRAADPEAVARAVVAAEQRLTDLETRLAGIDEATTWNRAQLELIGAEGRQEVYDRARTAATVADRQWRRLDAQAQAARLLFETLCRHRESARTRYVVPLHDRIVDLGRILFGPDFDVQLDADLRVVARTLDGVTVGHDQLSTGAREQLAIITRLACAAAVGPDGVPVIIDDALGYTDPERVRRMQQVFAGVQSSIQVILLTSNPARYAGVEATVIALAATPAGDTSAADTSAADISAADMSAGTDDPPGAADPPAVVHGSPDPAAPPDAEPVLPPPGRTGGRRPRHRAVPIARPVDAGHVPGRDAAAADRGPGHQRRTALLAAGESTDPGLFAVSD